MFFETLELWLIIQLKVFPSQHYNIIFQRGEHFTRNWLLMSEKEREEYYNTLHSLHLTSEKEREEYYNALHHRYLVLQNKEESPPTVSVDPLPSPFSSTNSLMSTVSNISWENEDFEI